jgi:myo-inositol-1(or 4)-monophosphatase
VTETDAVLDLAVRLAREAGALQRDRYEREVAIATKSTPTDLVTEVDHACEELIVDSVRAERSADAILAEEGRHGSGDASGWRWVIDPLDGTVNFAHGYPRFCVSIGVERRGERRVGVVYDPLLDELYAAVRGQGARCNGRPLRVSGEAELGRALLATGFAYDVKQTSRNLDHFAAFVRAARGVRRDGSAALDLCYVASGRLDGYWELELNPWDVCAGALIVSEAGGQLSDLTGGPLPSSGGQVVASNGRIHAAMLAALAGVAAGT